MKKESINDTDLFLAFCQIVEGCSEKVFLGNPVFIKHIVPFLGGILTGHPRAYRYLQQSIDDFPSPSEFVTLLEGLRCDVRGAANDTKINKNVVGYFKVDELVNLNFGSVQLYTMTALLRSIE